MKESPVRNEPMLERQALVAVLSTAKAITASATRVLTDHGLTFTQYNALRILRGAGSGGLTCSEISERMVTRDSDITRLLDRLEHMELIERRRGTNDRRVVRAFTSKRGLQLLAALDEPMDQWGRDTFSHLGSQGLQSVVELLTRLKTPLEESIEHR